MLRQRMIRPQRDGSSSVHGQLSIRAESLGGIPVTSRRGLNFHMLSKSLQ